MLVDMLAHFKDLAVTKLRRLQKVVTGQDDCCIKHDVEHPPKANTPAILDVEGSQNPPTTEQSVPVAQAEGAEKRSRPCHNRNASWPMASFMKPPESHASGKDAELDEDDGETIHSLESSAPHEWVSAAETRGSIMSFLVDRRKCTIDMQQAPSIARSQSCPSLSRRSSTTGKIDEESVTEDDC